MVFHKSISHYNDPYRVEFKDWPTMKTDKEKFPFGTMPVLEKDGKYYQQAMAILKMLGREHGYYPSDPTEAYHQDVAIETLRDFWKGVYDMKDMADEERKEAFGKFGEGLMSKLFTAWEGHISENSSQHHWHGDKVTLADIGMATLYAGIMNRGPGKDFFQSQLDNWPVLKEYFEKRYEEHKDYFESRPECPF